MLHLLNRNNQKQKRNSMQNLFLLPTEKPSRLFKFANQLHLDTIPKDYYKKYNIYITSDEEIKELAGDLKKLCGVGGTVKNHEILIQGDHREKVKSHLIKKGYSGTKTAGG